MLSLSLLLTTGCGFHLRGIQELPAWLNKVAIIIQQANPDWEPLLREQLQSAHVVVVEDPSQAPYWLMIQQESTQANIISISSGSSPRQYQLVYRVIFTLQRAKGADVIPPTTLLVTRPLTINNDRILGSHDEEEQLKHEMRRDAAIQMLYRMNPRSNPLLNQLKRGSPQ